MTLEEVVRAELSKRGVHGFAISMATTSVVREVGKLLDEEVARQERASLERCWAYEHMIPFEEL